MCSPPEPMRVPGGRNTFSMNLSVEMWSKVSGQTQPPALKGEITRPGVRNPRPTGPSTPYQSVGGPPAALEGDNVVAYSPSYTSELGIPAKVVTVGPGVGGAMWSKNPPF